MSTNNILKQKSSTTMTTIKPQQEKIKFITTRKSKTVSTELKIKMESVGIHPMEDDDLEMCPARTRPAWPKKIVPWWVSMDINEKPPHSYATLIAHAIFESKDGRLTLSEIYASIAILYPSFSIGNGGWQNSIRHNLSLNKKWFYKMDRRPTQKNPGKGSYWTLVDGTEHIFIENLTHETGHSRKHHDIGLTNELSIGQRRGACFYFQQRSAAVVTSDLITSPVQASEKPSSSSPLYTTFRMVDMNQKPVTNTTRQSKRLKPRHCPIPTYDSDNDSGVDVNISSVVKSKRSSKKRKCISNNNQMEETSSASSPFTPQLSFADETVKCSSMEPEAATEWMFYTGPQFYNDYQWTTPIEDTTMTDLWTPPSLQRQPEPITIDLEQQEIYLPLEQELLSNRYMDVTPSPSSLMHYHHNDYYTDNLYPYIPQFFSSSSLTHNQFVSMQDISYF